MQTTYKNQCIKLRLLENCSLSVRCTRHPWIKTFHRISQNGAEAILSCIRWAFLISVAVAFMKNRKYPFLPWVTFEAARNLDDCPNWTVGDPSNEEGSFGVEVSLLHLLLFDLDRSFCPKSAKMHHGLAGEMLFRPVVTVGITLPANWGTECWVRSCEKQPSPMFYSQTKFLTVDI